MKKRLLRKPKLKFETVHADPSVNQQGVAFYHIRVTNVGKTTATSCHLRIKYKDYSLNMIKTLDTGKWDKNPEPVSYIFNKTDPSLMRYIGEVDIKAKSSQTFCYLIKHSGKIDCYGFNAENYLLGNCFKLNDRQLVKGDYIITIEVKGDNAKGEAHFLVINKGNQVSDISIIRKKGNY